MSAGDLCRPSGPDGEGPGQRPGPMGAWLTSPSSTLSSSCTMVDMLSTIMAAVVPLASVLLGAGVTYWLNVYSRRSNRIEDLFDAAISATAVADVSLNYAHLSGIGRPPGITDQDFQALGEQLVRDGLNNYFKRASEAREAIARVLPYEPRVKPYYQNPIFVNEQIEEIVNILTESKTRYVGRDRKAVSRSWPPGRWLQRNRGSGP